MSRQDFMNHSSHFQPVVLAPTYNNARMLYDVLTDIARQVLPMLVVNDGSTDDTPAILLRWQSERGDGPAREIETHPINRGKADALLTGFAVARERGYTHVVTIDTDGQLDPTQIADLLAEAKSHPHALIVGDRDQTAPDYPKNSRIGRRISNFWVRVECGAKLSDTQCGFRVYPLRLIENLRCHGRRYGFETEILTRAAWAGAEIRHVPVTCTYEVPGGRISHLNPLIDPTRHVGMHALLLGRSFLPIGVQRVDSPEHPISTGTLWRRMTRALVPPSGQQHEVTTADDHS